MTVEQNHTPGVTSAPIASSGPPPSDGAAPATRGFKLKIIPKLLKFGPLLLILWFVAIVLLMGPDRRAKVQTAPANWWEAPAANVVDDLVPYLDSATRDGFRLRERMTFILAGDQVLSSDTSTLCSGEPGKFRNDVYTGGNLQQSDWYIEQQEDAIVQTDVNHREKTYFIDDQLSPSKDLNRMAQIRYLVQSVRRSTAEPTISELEGHLAVCFEVVTSRDDASTEQMRYRVWFDTTNRLPLKTEIDLREDKSAEGGGGFGMIMTHDHFEWGPTFEDNTFVPVVPDGYREVAPEVK